MDIRALVEKYRVAAPRYTSYPTVPYWDEQSFEEKSWLDALASSLEKENRELSLYIHLPFCESLCTYCGCNTRITKNHGVERPYIEAVLKEWQQYIDILGYKPVIREIHLGGGTPTFFSPENLALLIHGLRDMALVREDAEFSFEGHPNNTTAGHLDTLFGLGFKRLSLGIQDFDPDVQRVINRIQSFESVREVTVLARGIGYHSVNYDLIYGLPLQSLNGLCKTIDQVIELRPDRIAFYSYAHVPWVKPGQRRYTEKHLPSTELKQQLYEVGRRKLIEAGYSEIGMDHFTLKSDSLYIAGQQGTLHRNFMGYTGHDGKILIGLGVSSISDSWTAFAQNAKSVEEYMQLISIGILPIVKGHILDETDLVIRRHILNIMCSGCTSWRLPEHRPKGFDEGLVRMRQLVEDGLVELNEWDLRVTDPGRRFIRNICMALDLRLWAGKPATQLFSIAD